MAADQRLQDLLIKTSRTFALAIPQLPQPTQREVTIAYLLFRIADTLEDASVLWSRPRQLEALDEFDALMRQPTVERARTVANAWLRDPPSDHDGYNELLTETGFVIERFLALSPEAQASIAAHTRRTARLMADFAFTTLGAARIEGRSAVENARGNAALRKLGAEQEGVMRRCFECSGGVVRDHILWALLDDDWRRAKQTLA